MHRPESIRASLEYHESDSDQGVERTYRYYGCTSTHIVTKKQEVDIIESPFWGKMLFLDGVLQSTTKDETIYHNALVHPLLDTLQKKSSILILGGGEGATAREVLRWSAVTSVTMVEYDPELVIEMEKKGNEWSNGAFDDSRLTIVYDDAWKYMETPGKHGLKTYDGIIIDLTDPDLLVERWSYLLELAILHVKQGGIVMNAGLYLPWNTTKLKMIKEMVEELCLKYSEFKYYMYTTMIPSFNGEWTFIVIANRKRLMIDPDKIDIIPAWIRRSIRMLEPGLLDEPVDTRPDRSNIFAYV